MKYLLCLCCLALTLHASTVNAAVNFIMDEKPVQTDSIKIKTSLSQKCINEGYDKTMCGEQFYLHNPCPHNSAYYRTCCPESYKHTQEQCKEMGLLPTTHSCAGLYGCY